MTFSSYRKIERVDVETRVIENIATGNVYANGLDIHYSKGLVYWTGYNKIMRYDIHYNTGFMYLTDVVDKRIMTYFITHFTFIQDVPLASGSVNA